MRALFPLCFASQLRCGCRQVPGGHKSEGVRLIAVGIMIFDFVGVQLAVLAFGSQAAGAARA